MPPLKKIVFLYTELAGYTLSCLQHLASTGAEVHVIHYPVNSEAPFQFRFGENVRFYPRKGMSAESILSLVEKIGPHLIVCSGWIDKDYVSVCRKVSGKIRTVLALDNKWEGRLRQRIAALLGRFTISRYFRFAWVPGKAQQTYARKLGFSPARIFTGFYSCDHARFSRIRQETHLRKLQLFPRRFIFSGRYYEFKGIEELWRAFTELKAETGNDWELWCLGTGTAVPVQHPSIKHFGFVQPDDLDDLLAQTGVFVMPSRFEPWGVVLHEFTAAGFPVICSDKVGAKEAFLREGENGYSFRAGHTEELKAVMKKIMDLSAAELNAMGERSAELAGTITPDTWSETVSKIMNS